MADIDGDGDLDIVEGNETQKTRYYLNDGDADPFTPLTTGFEVSTDSPETYGLALHDMDRDGDLDVVAAVRNEANRVYLNDGAGLFGAPLEFGDEAGNTYSMSVGDIDGDGDFDITSGNSGQLDTVSLQRLFDTGLGRVASGTVNTGESVTVAALTATGVTNDAATRNTAIDYYMSNDGGAQWWQVRSGEDFTFPASGTDLRWKAQLSTLSPVI